MEPKIKLENYWSFFIKYTFVPEGKVKKIKNLL